MKKLSPQMLSMLAEPSAPTVDALVRNPKFLALLENFYWAKRGKAQDEAIIELAKFLVEDIVPKDGQTHEP